MDIDLKWLVIIILSVLVLNLYTNKQYIEGMSSGMTAADYQAVQNIASLYNNKGTLTVPNLKVMDTIHIGSSGDQKIHSKKAGNITFDNVNQGLDIPNANINTKVINTDYLNMNNGRLRDTLHVGHEGQGNRRIVASSNNQWIDMTGTNLHVYGQLYLNDDWKLVPGSQEININPFGHGAKKNIKTLFLKKGNNTRHTWLDV